MTLSNFQTIHDGPNLFGNVRYVRLYVFAQNDQIQRAEAACF